MSSSLLGTGTFVAEACLICSHIDTKKITGLNILDSNPLSLALGENGFVFVFRFGALIFINFTQTEKESFLSSLNIAEKNFYEQPITDQITLKIDVATEREGIDIAGVVCLKSADLKRLQVVASVLAKSVALNYYEDNISDAMINIEILADDLQQGVKSLAPNRVLLRQLGVVIKIQSKTVGLVQVTEKPDFTWDDPHIDQLYMKMSSEFELHERDGLLTKKLELISRTAETYLDLIQNRRSLRVEWYIVILIVVEIVILLFDMFMLKID